MSLLVDISTEILCMELSARAGDLLNDPEPKFDSVLSYVDPTLLNELKSILANIKIARPVGDHLEMSDLNEMAEQHRMSDVSLMNFLHNNVTSLIRKRSGHWIARTDTYRGDGSDPRSALLALTKRIRDARG